MGDKSDAEASPSLLSSTEGRVEDEDELEKTLASEERTECEFKAQPAGDEEQKDGGKEEEESEKGFTSHFRGSESVQNSPEHNQENTGDHAETTDPQPEKANEHDGSKNEGDKHEAHTKTDIPRTSKTAEQSNKSPVSERESNPKHSGTKNGQERLYHRHRRHRSVEDHAEIEPRKSSYVRLDPHRHHSHRAKPQSKGPETKEKTRDLHHKGHRGLNSGSNRSSEPEKPKNLNAPLAMRMAMAVRDSIQGRSVHESRPLSMPPLSRKHHQSHDSHHGFDEHTLSAFVRSASHQHRSHYHDRKQLDTKGQEMKAQNLQDEAKKEPTGSGDEVPPEDSVSQVHE